MHLPTFDATCPHSLYGPTPSMNSRRVFHVRTYDQRGRRFIVNPSGCSFRRCVRKSMVACIAQAIGCPSLACKRVILPSRRRRHSLCSAGQIASNYGGFKYRLRWMLRTPTGPSAIDSAATAYAGRYGTAAEKPCNMLPIIARPGDVANPRACLSLS